MTLKCLENFYAYFIVIGVDNDMVSNKTRAYDWVRGTFNGASKEFLSHHQELNSDKFCPKFASAPSPGATHNQILRSDIHLQSLPSNRGFGANIPDGNSHGSSSKHSDSMSDDASPYHRLSHNGAMVPNGIEDTKTDVGHIPYEVLIHDLTQAKRQLLDLQSLVSNQTVL